MSGKIEINSLPWESWRFRLAEDVSGLVGGGGGVGLDGGGSGLGGGADAADPDGLGGSSSFFAAAATDLPGAS